MGIDQLGFQSVQLGYLKILKMGNTDPNNTKAGKRIRVYQPGKSSVRDHQARQPSQLGGFQTQLISWSPTDDSVGPFRHDTSVCRSQSGSISDLTQARQLQFAQLASSLVTKNATETSWELNSEAHTDRRKLYSTVVRTYELTASSLSLSNVDSGHLTGINRKSYSRRAQRHQSRSKQRRKSTTIYRRSVRMNSNYRGFHWRKR
ncbi:hypothetical protein F511_43573 [Dorcoceras hygrometricum]|uniref:Uncharacterized protein n=1 Tax=Dorcoceras hygrometricum TaxID=472368 RepID=A0A2Z7A692_9LAMI|nr:hypothetical protein F511_43573 [Dorcoceras hygrometricum]